MFTLSPGLPAELRVIANSLQQLSIINYQLLIAFLRLLQFPYIFHTEYE